MSTRKPNAKPVTVPAALHDQIALGMRLLYESVKVEPRLDSINHLAQLLGMVGLAIEEDKRFKPESAQVDSAMRALDQIVVGTSGPTQAESVLAAVNAADKILPRLLVEKLHKANLRMYDITALK